MGVYRYGFRFNASHSNSYNLNNLHTHSFNVTICIEHKADLLFSDAEKDIKAYISQYKGKCLNDMFDQIPILEVIAKKFYQDLTNIIKHHHISSIEISDTPTQVYILKCIA